MHAHTANQRIYGTTHQRIFTAGSVFGDTVIATAVLDRLLHHATTINIRGGSYRMEERKKAKLHSPESREVALNGTETTAHASH